MNQISQSWVMIVVVGESRGDGKYPHPGIPMLKAEGRKKALRSTFPLSYNVKDSCCK